MPFVLKQLTTIGDNELPPVHIFAGTIKIGSGANCDLVVNTKKIKSLHCELYHMDNEFRFVPAPSAFVEINDSDVEKWPAILSDGDILTIGDIKFQFNIMQPTPKRSWKASFASTLAICLLVILIIFEIAIMAWLPFELTKRKAWELSASKEEVMRQIDDLRSGTNKLDTSNQSEDRIKKVLLTVEDNIAKYLRQYGDSMDREQTRETHKDLFQMQIIINKWKYYKNDYTMNNSINPKNYINNLCNHLEQQAATMKPTGNIDYSSKN